MIGYDVPSRYSSSPGPTIQCGPEELQFPHSVKDFEVGLRSIDGELSPGLLYTPIALAAGYPLVLFFAEWHQDYREVGRPVP